MNEESNEQSSNPLATTEEIHRRLVRPSKLQSTPPAIAISDVGDAKSHYYQKKLTEKKKKLEDYLDPGLLSAICSKIRREKKFPDQTKENSTVKDFEWPVDELKVFMVDTKTWRSREFVDLKD